MELNGLPTNLEDVERKYALERIFVPLSFKRFEGRKEDTEELLEAYREAEIAVGDSLAFREKMKPVTLDKVVPPDGNFCCFILSDPGGGKTTLLKILAGVISDYTGEARIRLQLPGGLPRQGDEPAPAGAVPDMDTLPGHPCRDPALAVEYD